MSKRKEILDIVLCYIGTMLGVLAVRFFNVYVMMSIPLIPRMAVIIAMYWVIALAAIIITLIRKEPAKTYGFFKNMMLIQIGIGAAVAIVMSVVFTLVPHLAGFGQFFDTGNRYEYLWQYITDMSISGSISSNSHTVFCQSDSLKSLYSEDSSSESFRRYAGTMSFLS